MSDSEKSRVQRVGANLRVRAQTMARARSFFLERGYLEVDTPVLVPSPGLDVHLDAFEVMDSRGRKAGYLSTSPEYQMKRLLAGGMHKIFQLCRCFRFGEKGRRHNPEFTMLEWYTAGFGLKELMDETEALVRHLLLPHAHGSYRMAGGACDVSQDFERLSVAEAFERYAAVSAEEVLALAQNDETRFFRILVDVVEPGLSTVGAPVMLHSYPASQASLARLSPDNPKSCERFELYFGELELCNGFAELTDPIEQRTRLEKDLEIRRALDKPAYPIDERFLGALEQGMPDAAGNALGIDRIVALCCDADEIGDVQAFPFDWL